MRRKTFDRLVTMGGLVVMVVLIAAGSLLAWGGSYLSGQVHNQLAEQKIYFPPKGSTALASPKIGPYLDPYAGQQLTNGQQAEVWADHFIGVHVTEIDHGLTYAQASEQALAHPNNKELAAKVQVLFQGQTLRGLLLSAYAFWQMGQIAGDAALAAFCAAGLMLVLVLAGLWHGRKVSEAAEL
jgi:hypothetical protein